MKIKVNKYVFLGIQGHAEEFLSRMQHASLVKFGESVFCDKTIEEKNIEDLKASYLLISKNFSYNDDKSAVLKDLIKDNDKINVHADYILSMQEKQANIMEELDKLKNLMNLYNILGIDSVLEIEKDFNSVYRLQVVSSKEEIQEDFSMFASAIFAGDIIGKKWYLIFRDVVSLEDGENFPVEYPGGVEFLDISSTMEDLEKKKSELQEINDEIQKRLSIYYCHHNNLNKGFAKAIDYERKQEAMNNICSIDDARLFVIEGWAREDQFEELMRVCNISNVTMFHVNKEEAEIEPTCLENHGVGKVGEDIVNLYDVPHFDDLEVSWKVLVFFGLFYGIIVGDAGYGLLQVGLFGALLVKYKAGEYIRSLLKVAILFGLSTICWGLFTGNVFGVDLAGYKSTENIVPIKYIAEKKQQYIERSISVSASKKSEPNLAIFRDYGHYEEVRNSILFEFALIIGCFHIIFGMLLDCSRRKANIGWALAIIGAFFAVSGYMNAVNIYDYMFSDLIDLPVYAFANYMIIIGVMMAVIISIMSDGLVGVFELMNVVQVFSDVMSYLRLYALGMSGSIMASTFNHMGMKLGIFGIPIILAGHAINILLCLMGGAIHGTRLNFVEWFRYCFSGGGLLFNPLSKVKDMKKEL